MRPLRFPFAGAINDEKERIEKQCPQNSKSAEFNTCLIGLLEHNELNARIAGFENSIDSCTAWYKPFTGKFSSSGSVLNAGIKSMLKILIYVLNFSLFVGLIILLLLVFHVLLAKQDRGYLEPLKDYFRGILGGKGSGTESSSGSRSMSILATLSVAGVIAISINFTYENIQKTAAARNRHAQSNHLLGIIDAVQQNHDMLLKLNEDTTEEKKVIDEKLAELLELEKQQIERLKRGEIRLVELEKHLERFRRDMMKQFEKLKIPVAPVNVLRIDTINNNSNYYDFSKKKGAGDDSKDEAILEGIEANREQIDALKGAVRSQGNEQRKKIEGIVDYIVKRDGRNIGWVLLDLLRGYEPRNYD